MRSVSACDVVKYVEVKSVLEKKLSERYNTPKRIHISNKMPQQDSPKKPVEPAKLCKRKFFERQPLLAYIALTFGLMLIVLMAEQGTEFFRASIIQAPSFDGTVMPIKQAPDWLMTGGKNDLNFSQYSAGTLIDIPKYDGKKLAARCEDEYGHPYTNACLTYTTVYMGNYHLDHKEFGGSHLAIDIRVPTGTPVYAVANGIVEIAESRVTGFGRYIVVRHDNVPLVGGGTDTLYSAYAHLSQVGTNEGVIVKKGDLIGYSGSSGISTTPHLHFQIDRSRAPFHPWWPFSSAEASNAKLNFYDGIDYGLGQDEAIKNTINPLEWVQHFLSYASDDRVSDPSKTPLPTNDNEVIVAVESFDLRSDKSTYITGDKLQLTVVAFDTKQNILRKYSGDNATLSVSNNQVVLPELKFEDGKATPSITLSSAGEYTFSIRDGKAIKALRIVVEQGEITSSPSGEVAITDNVEGDNVPVAVRLSSEDTFVFAGNHATIEVVALDKNGIVMQNLNYKGELAITVDGVGSVEPNSLKDRYFKNGVAKIDFSAGREIGAAKIALERFPQTNVEFQVIDKAEPVTKFEIELDGKFDTDKKETATIKTLDNKGNVTPTSFLGSATVSVASGSAKLDKTKLTSADFTNGVATLTFVPQDDKESIQLKIKSGALVGESKFARFEEASGSLFSDISQNNPNYEAIADLTQKNILNGNPDGTFRPDAGINRAEFAKVILLALGVDPQNPERTSFSDVKLDAWFAKFVEAAARMDIIKGYPNGNFGPANNINRAELFTMLYRAVKEQTGNGNNFADVPSDAWFAEAARFAKSKNLLDFGNSFEPSKVMTRAEVAEAVSRFLSL